MNRVQEDFLYAERYRKLLAACTMNFPLLAVSYDPENDNTLVYNPDKINYILDNLDLEELERN